MKSLEPRLWPSFRVISRSCSPELLELIDKTVLSLWNYGRAIVFIGNEKSMQIPSPLWIMEIIFGEKTITTNTTITSACQFRTRRVIYIAIKCTKDSFAFTKNGKAYAVCAQKIFHYDESSRILLLMSYFL